MHLLHLVLFCNYYDDVTNVIQFNYWTTQALNKLRKKTWCESYNKVNPCPSTRVPFNEYIERVKDVVDARDYLYYNRDGKFEAMPEFWNNLYEDQRRSVSTLIDSFYDEYRTDRTKDKWAIGNIKKYLDLEFVSLVELTKFQSAYLESLGGDSVFADPPLCNAAIKDAGNMKLIGDHDGFALKPKMLMKKYK